MKLGRKNLAYSMALAGVMLLFLVGYFIYMLPSLYVDHMMEENLKSIRLQHKAYVENRSYEDVQVRNATACFSVELPKEGDSIRVTGRAFSAEIVIKDDRLYRLLERFREKLGAGWLSADGSGDDQGPGSGEAETDRKQGDGSAGLRQELEELAEVFRRELEEMSSLPVEFRLLYLQDVEGDFFGESVKYHYYSDGCVIIEAGIWDADNHYTNYMAVEQTQESLILSYLPVLTPGMDEIRPIVLQSLPMLGAVIMLLVLLFSRVYSKGIVTPMVELAEHTEEMKSAQRFDVGRLSERWPGRRDEIRVLADVLDDFYLQIREGYLKLEEENKRQEIFLRASSHQLKTPIAAALLLVDGMMGQVGRYKDTGQYLPKVKEELLSMRKIVEDILYLNHCAENIQLQKVDVGRLVEERVQAYQVVLADKGIRVRLEKGLGLTAYVDEMMTMQIIDNLLSNGAKYTPEGGCMEIGLCGRCTVRMENHGVTIPEELLPHILEPFVSGSHGKETGGVRSQGLGLYIASYYAKKLGLLLRISNGEDSVVAELCFPDPRRPGSAP